MVTHKNEEHCSQVPTINNDSTALSSVECTSIHVCVYTAYIYKTSPAKSQLRSYQTCIHWSKRQKAYGPHHLPELWFLSKTQDWANILPHSDSPKREVNWVITAKNSLRNYHSHPCRGFNAEAVIQFKTAWVNFFNNFSWTKTKICLSKFKTGQNNFAGVKGERKGGGGGKITLYTAWHHSVHTSAYEENNELTI